MPVYCFKNVKTGKIVEKIFHMNEVPWDFKDDTGKYERCFRAELAGRTQCSSTWPMKSKALAVHPSQVGEYSKFAEQHGVPTHFDSMGRPEFRTKGHRKNYCELVGATDFEGGYGDPTTERNRHG